MEHKNQLTELMFGSLERWRAGQWSGNISLGVAVLHGDRCLSNHNSANRIVPRTSATKLALESTPQYPSR